MVHVRRNLFNWGHTCSTTMKTGEFTPILSTVVPPNTTISGDMLFGVTADVPLRPIKWDYYFEAVAFVTPRRICYDRDRYQRFITGAANGKVLPDDHEDSISANFKFPALETESVLCHMGYQDGIAFNFAQTTEELRAMAMIWNWYVRDENLDDEIDVPLTSGTDDPSKWWPNYDKASGMLHVNQFKDYFTCAANSTLKGSPVPVPQFGGDLQLSPSVAPVQTGATAQAVYNGPVKYFVYGSDIPGGFVVYDSPAGINPSYTLNPGTVLLDKGILFQNPSSYGANLCCVISGSTVSINGVFGGVFPGTLILDITSQSTITSYNNQALLSGIRVIPPSLAGTPLINDLRFAVQREISKIMDMRAGNRYNEYMEAHFDSKVGDNLIQIPQFVNACKQRIRFSQVLQTSAATDDDPLGSFGGFAQTGNRLRINWYCPEESILQVFAFIRPRPGYQQGAARWRTELTRFDRYDTPYAHLGMQAIKGREICVTNDEEFNNSDWGYQDIWDHLRHIPSRVNGLFRTNKSMWTSQRIFDPATPPQLNSDFIKVSSADSDRNFSADGVAPWVVDVDCGLYVLAPLPKRGTPGLMDHIRV